MLCLSGCAGHEFADGPTADLKERLTVCPPSGTYNSIDLLDGSGSSQDPVLLDDRWGAVRAHLIQAAVCGGHARVVVGSSSSATSVILLDTDLEPAGATENARLRRVEELVDANLATAKEAYNTALPELDTGGTDMTAAYFSLADYITERDSVVGEQVYSAQVETDGIQNVGIDLSAPSLSVESSEALTSSVHLPQLDERISVTFLGIGKVAGTEQPSTDYVNGLKAFWSATCKATGAGSCTVLTDFGGGSQ
ncbi:hypothetical protein C5B95_07160 [Rathayibacter sp. AY1A7]|nr:hypothetical protein C5B95_07160 [Rathayibacter sp. AY1A7]